MSIANSLATKLGLFRSATVESADTVAPGFRKVILAGDALKHRPFTPGDKVQLILEEGARTYTPGYRAETGQLSLLIYVHDDTPGAAFGRDAKADVQVNVFGPRGSIDFTRVKSPAVFFGDETSIAAASVFAQHHGQPAHVILEATDPSATGAALEAMRVDAQTIIERTRNESHLDVIAEQVIRAIESRPTLIMTGRAQSIQAVQKRIGAAGVRAGAKFVKAYWSVGRRGLD